MDEEVNLARDASSLGAPDLFPPLSPTRVAPSVLAPQGQSECETTGCMRGASGTLSGTPDRVTVHTLPVLSRHPTEQTFETAEWGKRNRDQRRSRPCVGLHLRRRSLFGYDGPRRTKRFCPIDSFADPQTDVASGVTRGRHVRSRCRCSMCPAIHINSRSWLRSSSTPEPSDPPLRVVKKDAKFDRSRRATRTPDATARSAPRFCQ